MGRGKKRRRGRRMLPGKGSQAVAENDAVDLDIVDDAPEPREPQVAPGAPSSVSSSGSPRGAPTQEVPAPHPGPAPADAGEDDAPPAVTPTPTRPGGEDAAEAPPGVAPSPEPAVAPPPAPAEHTLGEVLQQAREARGMSLEEVSAHTRIALHHLRHLESDRYAELPAEAYVKGFLRSYGGALGLDVGLLVRRYETVVGSIPTRPEIWEDVEARPRRRRRWRPRVRTLRWIGAVLVVLALAWVFWSQGATRLGLRPRSGLEQIEAELLQDGAPAPALAPAPGGANPPAPTEPSSDPPAAGGSPEDDGGPM